MAKIGENINRARNRNKLDDWNKKTLTSEDFITEWNKNNEIVMSNDRFIEILSKLFCLLVRYCLRKNARIRLLTVIIISEDRISKIGKLINEFNMDMVLFPKPFKSIFAKRKLAKKIIISNAVGYCSFANNLTKILLLRLDFLDIKIKAKNKTLNTNIVIRFAELLGSKTWPDLDWIEILRLKFESLAKPETIWSIKTEEQKILNNMVTIKLKE